MEISNPVMSKSLDPLRTTTPDLHRFWFVISTEQQWYAIMRECRAWFEVPDVQWSTWIATKLALQVRSETKNRTNK